MKGFDILAIIAGACTTTAMLPQIFKIVRTRHTKDLSLPMYVIFSFGVGMWTYYGMMIRSAPVVIFNFITFLLSLYILFAKIIYK